MATKFFPGVYTRIKSSASDDSGGTLLITGTPPAPPAPPGPPPPGPDPLLGLDLIGFSSFGPMGGITVINFNMSSSIGGFDIESNPEIVEIHFPNLVSIDPTFIQGGFLFVTGNTNLVILDMPVFVPNPGDSYTLSGNAFNAASVNAFLRRCVLNASYTSGTVNMSGGTSVAPTGQGITDKATLIGRGVSVNTL